MELSLRMCQALHIYTVCASYDMCVRVYNIVEKDIYVLIVRLKNRQT